ncbi:MAG: hypothetical protein AB1505_20090 [Candidatus Latescibacterota bacterium]
MSQANAVEWVRYVFPRPEHPCYHVEVALRVEAARDWKVREARINGRRVRDLWIYNEGEAHKLRVLQRGRLASVVLRCDWSGGASYAVEVELEEDGGARTQTLVHESTAQGSTGYWDTRWKHYLAVVLRENSGLARQNEPVHVTLATYADRLTDPQREVRVVAVEPLSGRQTEIPSQTYHPSTWTTPQPDKYCQNTTTCEVAFLADVPAWAEKVFLVFYGNPEAPTPQYQTDLTVSGEGLEMTIENSYYRMHTQPTGGAIDEIFMKMGVDALFEHRLETNGAVQWNPGIYSPKRPWIHTSDWNPPDHYGDVRGPVFHMFKRWGGFADYPEVQFSVTYLFYAYNPYLVFNSTFDVVQDIHCIALRNGEFVFNHAVFEEFAWRRPDGGVGSMVIKSGPRHPRHAQRLEADTPWLAYYSRRHGCGFGAMTLNLAEMRRSDGLPRKDYPYIYLAWGPWTYFSRVYTYAFGSNNPQRMVKVGSGTTYYEQMAFMPFQLGGTEEDRFLQLEERYDRLADPLDWRLELDTDERVPEEWVPPILVAQFEEMEDAEDV